MPAAGWYATLIGSSPGALNDLRTWHSELTGQAEATVLPGPMDIWFLQSASFSEAADHHEVRKRAYPLLDELNVRMALLHATLPLTINTVDLVHADGHRESWLAMHDGLEGAKTVPDGPRSPKHVLRALPKPDRVKLLLKQHRKAASWPEIYGTLELAELIAGNQHTLARLLGGQSKSYEALRAWANTFRHEAPCNSATPVSFADAKPLLETIVRTALANVVEARPSRG